MSKVLVLASYCGAEDDNGCTDTNPCPMCIEMCNVFDIPSETLRDYQFVAELEALRRGLGRKQP
jgi:hypothetical protein